MQPRLGTLVVSLCVASTVLAHSAPSKAALDEIIGKNDKDATTELVAGQRIRRRTRDALTEYGDAAGKIFALRWRGLYAPHLRTLLGAHFPAYEKALRAHRNVGLNSVRLSTPELTITSHSHGAFAVGFVYLTGALPKGVSVDALR